MILDITDKKIVLFNADWGQTVPGKMYSNWPFLPK